MNQSSKQPHSKTMNDMPKDYAGAGFDAHWRALVAPDDHQNPTPQDNYNLIVIGAGPAGLITSIAAAGLGAKVALIERHAMGGDCLNVGCVPSKAVLAAARRFQGQPDAFQRSMAWLREVRAGIAEHDSVQRYSEQGVDVFLGQAAFNADGTVQVGDVTLRASKTVITTGSRAAMPPIPGLDEVPALTNEQVFDLVEQPRELLIIGAGAIGCELSQAFARLGSKVRLLEIAPRILAGEEPEASAVLQQAMDELGVAVSCEVQIERVSHADGVFTVYCKSGEQYQADQLLVAAGRQPNLDGLQLDAVGVKHDRRGIDVDDKLRTSQRNIFAAGDVCSALKLTHFADAQARIVIANALFLPTAKRSAAMVPRCTYTDPEVAHVGLTSADAEQQGLAVKSWRVDWQDMDRARAEGDTRGYVEVLTKPGDDKILGATIVGAHAGDLLAPLLIMQANALGLAAADKAMLPYPTRGEYLRRLSDQVRREKLTPGVAKWMRRWLAWRR